MCFFHRFFLLLTTLKAEVDWTKPVRLFFGFLKTSVSELSSLLPEEEDEDFSNGRRRFDAPTFPPPRFARLKRQFGLLEGSPLVDVPAGFSSFIFIYFLKLTIQSLNVLKLPSRKVCYSTNSKYFGFFPPRPTKCKIGATVFRITTFNVTVVSISVLPRGRINNIFSPLTYECTQ